MGFIGDSRSNRSWVIRVAQFVMDERRRTETTSHDKKIGRNAILAFCLKIARNIAKINQLPSSNSWTIASLSAPDGDTTRASNGPRFLPRSTANEAGLLIWKKNQRHQLASLLGITLWANRVAHKNVPNFPLMWLLSSKQHINEENYYFKRKP